LTEASQTLPDYDSIDAVLLAQGVSMSPAEVQGILTGVLCLPDADKVDWLELILSTEGNVGLEPGKEFSELLLNLFRSTQAQLADSEFGFSLLLPEQDSDITSRAEAIAAWCRGFLLGISSTGLTAENCSDTVREILGDVVELSGVEAGQEEDTESERALAEIEEYLRVAARLLKEELGSVSSI
jgi:yecA family protein